MSDGGEDDWHALAGGPPTVVGPSPTSAALRHVHVPQGARNTSPTPATTSAPPVKLKGSKYGGVGSEGTGSGGEGGPIMVALDTIVAGIGVICLIVTLLALTSNVFEPEEEEVVQVANTSSTSRSSKSIDRRVHALFDGVVGKQALFDAITARAKRKLALRRKEEIELIDHKVRSGELLGQDATSQLANGRSELQEDKDSHAEVDERTLLQISDAEREVFKDDASFYVSIAQFKDILCPVTIKELYEKARNPRRVFAGIVDQRDNNTLILDKGVGYPYFVKPPWVFHEKCDGTCFPWYMMKQCGTSDFCPTDNIRVRHSWPKDGKGPTWGRYYAMLMYQGESYFMMIDSHSRFAMHWDMQCIFNLYLVPRTSKKAVLSHYPGGFRDYDGLVSQRREPGHMTMCSAHYNLGGIIRMDSKGIKSNGYPVMQPFSAGGFVVGDAQFVHEVPFDPYLFYVFDGEEILYSVRLWTHGYDLFTPKNNILFHHYARHGAPRFWSLPGLNYAAEQQLGQGRVKYFMKSFKNQTTERMVSDEWVRKHKVDIEEEIYGLGKVRTLEEYYKFAGADPVKWTVSNDNCMAIQIVNNTRYKYNKEKKLYGE